MSISEIMASYQGLNTSHSSGESCDSSPETRARSNHSVLQDSSGDVDVNPFAVHPPFTKWDYVKVVPPKGHGTFAPDSGLNQRHGWKY